MSLIPYEPFRHLENMKRELDRFFTNDFSINKIGITENFGAPSIDVYETENEVIATCDIPGIQNREDITIDIENRMLSISGTIKREYEQNQERVHRQERFVGSFQRSVTLPTNVSNENVKARYKNGVLEIHMSKLNISNKKPIDIEFH